MTNGSDDPLGVSAELALQFIEAAWPHVAGAARRAALAMVGPYDPGEGHGPEELREAWGRLPVSVRLSILLLIGSACCDPDMQTTTALLSGEPPGGELLPVAAAWPKLAAAVRAGILAMVKAANESSTHVSL